MAERLEVLVAPTINFGMAQHHMQFPGTIALKPTTLLAVVKDIVTSLALHGFRHLYFLNGHGGNCAPVSAAFSEYYTDKTFASEADENLTCFTTLANWWKYDKVAALTKKLYADAEGWHATPSEVSLSYFARPKSVKHAKLSKEVGACGQFYDAVDYRKRFPDGRIGSDPSLASIEHGEQFYQLAVDAACKDFSKFCETS